MITLVPFLLQKGVVDGCPFTAEDFRSLVSTNVEGFLYITQLVTKQMLAQKSGGSVVSITTSLGRSPT